MSGTFIAFIVFAVLALCALPVSRYYNRKVKNLGENADRYERHNATSGRRISGIAFLALLGIAILLLIMSMLVMVGTKKVGVVTTFGKPTGTLSNGLHLKAPWDKVTEFDAAIQTDRHEGKKDGGNGECTTVRIGNQSTACVDNSIRWRIKQEAADELYRDYRDFDNVRDSLVTRSLIASLNEVYGGFDPLSSLDADGKFDPEVQTQLAANVLENLRNTIGEQIEILSVFTPFVDFDEQTQQKINLFQAEVANTRIAKQRQQTAAADAVANEKLSASVSNDPNVLVSKCLDTLNDAVKAKQPLPAGFSCWPGDPTAVAVQNRR